MQPLGVTARPKRPMLEPPWLFSALNGVTPIKRLVVAKIDCCCFRFHVLPFSFASCVHTPCLVHRHPAPRQKLGAELGLTCYRHIHVRGGLSQLPHTIISGEINCLCGVALVDRG